MQRPRGGEQQEPPKAWRLSACTQWLALLSSSGPARRRQPSPTSLPASRPKGQLPTPTRPAPHHPGQPLPQGQTSDNQILVASKHHIRSTKYWCFSPLLSLCQHCAIPSESPPQLTVWTTPSSTSQVTSYAMSFLISSGYTDRPFLRSLPQRASKPPRGPGRLCIVEHPGGGDQEVAKTGQVLHWLWCPHSTEHDLKQGLGIPK